MGLDIYIYFTIVMLIHNINITFDNNWKLTETIKF
jgi:hypothetical protein